MSILPSHWYYNTETGQLTQGNVISNLGNNLLGGLGWHELNIPGSATAAQAASEAQKEFPKGKKPTNAGITPGRIASVAAQEAGGSVLSGLAGDLASGLESGVTHLLMDVWATIYPALEIIAGVLIFIIGAVYINKDQLLKLAPLFAAAA